MAISCAGCAPTGYAPRFNWKSAARTGRSPLSSATRFAAPLGLSGDGPGAASVFAGGVAYFDPRLAAAGARVILPRAGAAETLQAAGLSAAAPSEYDRHRLALGLADGSRDMTVGRSILLECGFDELHGVDWDKGCFLGQELTARTKYRGLIKKRLVPVSVDGPLPPRGTAVVDEGHEVGEIRSGAGKQALAMLRLEAVAECIAKGEEELLVRGRRGPDPTADPVVAGVVKRARIRGPRVEVSPWRGPSRPASSAGEGRSGAPGTSNQAGRRRTHRCARSS